MMLGFTEVWVDFTFDDGCVQWIENGGVVLSLRDWVRIMIHLRARESEIEPYLRETHHDF